jgi:hypothetical protein
LGADDGEAPRDRRPVRRRPRPARRRRQRAARAPDLELLAGRQDNFAADREVGGEATEELVRTRNKFVDPPMTLRSGQQIARFFDGLAAARRRASTAVKNATISASQPVFPPLAAPAVSAAAVSAVARVTASTPTG